MKRFVFLLFSVLFGVFSCKKEKAKNDNQQTGTSLPTEVTFMYNGEPVTYGIITKHYYLDENGDSLSSPVRKYWLDRNLGAQRIAISRDDQMASGDLFQWGRLDDGHQLRSSQTRNEASNDVVPGHSDFINSSLSNNFSNWLSVPNDLLWNEPGNTNCPCPQGWRVPTIDELKMEMHSWSTPDWNGAFNSSLKWPTTGNRDMNGIIRYFDEWSFIWSSTVVNLDKVEVLAIIGTQTVETISASKIFGHAVRCIKK